jgi:anti-sigma factor ChrR (cupin superfamily)
VAADGQCVCLISADGPLVARDWVGRLFQPFVGI